MKEIASSLGTATALKNNCRLTVSFRAAPRRTGMKSIKCSIVLAIGLILFGKSAFGSDGTNDFVTTSFSVAGNQGTLTWSGGRPTYQVQTRSNLTANWVNVGAPTSNNFAVVPLVGD